MMSGFYTSAQEEDRSFDLHSPTVPLPGPAPLVIHFHGGAWRFGDKSSMLFSVNGQHRVRERLQASGYFVASVNYRLSHRALFPAQLHDAKSAVRYFRAHAEQFGVDPQRIMVSGASAGGHLAQLLAATPDSGNAYLEGSDADVASSDVAGAVSFYGVSDLRTIFDDRVACGLPKDHPDDDGAEARLLGSGYPAPDSGAAEQAWTWAHPVDYAKDQKLAPRHRPVFYVHGADDSCVPWIQSGTPHRALRARGVPTSLEIVPDAEHSDARIFHDDGRLRRIVRWVEERSAANLS